MLHLIDRALGEDIGEGDLTTAAVVPAGAQARAPSGTTVAVVRSPSPRSSSSARSINSNMGGAGYAMVRPARGT